MSPQQLQRDKAACNAACLAEKKSLAEKVLTSAVILDANMMGATARVSSVGLPGGPKGLLAAHGARGLDLESHPAQARRRHAAAAAARLAARLYRRFSFSPRQPARRPRAAICRPAAQPASPHMIRKPSPAGSSARPPSELGVRARNSGRLISARDR